jgi:hypothetical protein
LAKEKEEQKRLEEIDNETNALLKDEKSDENSSNSDQDEKSQIIVKPEIKK